MRILVSNDDGVLAPGIQALAEAMRTLGTVQVVAPDRNRSGASNSLTLHQPVRTKPLSNGDISVEGTPTDCVHLALTGLCEPQPQIVVSGINHGANLGDDILYSGTVAAAMEGRNLGSPAIAVSLAGEGEMHFTTAAEVTKQVVTRLMQDSLPAQSILNINVPNVPLAEIAGFEVTRLGTRHNAEPMIKSFDPRGREIYWVGPPGLEQDAGPGTDFHAINHNFVSITPLHIDLTHYQSFDQLSGWLIGMTASCAG